MWQLEKIYHGFYILFFPCHELEGIVGMHFVCLSVCLLFVFGDSIISEV